MADAGGSAINMLLGVLEGIDAYVYGDTTDFSTVGVKALDDHTLQYTLTEECPYFMTMIADACFTPMSRNYYLSQGGVFGIAEYDEAIASSTYMYGTDQDHIAYCGPYLCTNVTDKNSINYIGAGAIAKAEARLNEYSKFELGARTFQEMRALEQDRQERLTLSREDAEAFEKQRRELRFQRTQLQNHKQTLDRSKEKAEIKETARKIAQLDDKLADWSADGKPPCVSTAQKPRPTPPTTRSTKGACPRSKSATPASARER